MHEDVEGQLDRTWHLREHEERVEAAWHGHDHVYEPEPADPPPVLPPNEFDDGAPEGPRRGLIIGVGFMLVGLAMIAMSYADRPDPSSTAQAGATTTSVPLAPSIGTGTTAPVTAEGVGRGTVETASGRSTLRGFGEMQATIRSPQGELCQVCLMTATSEAQRQRGLMEVADATLGGYDGMLFEFPTEVDGAFWMRNTPLPLSIAYFDGAGQLVSTSDMAPCEDRKDCPTYPAADSFQFALEVPQGQLEELGIAPGATLTLDGRRCAMAGSGN